MADPAHQPIRPYSLSLSRDERELLCGVLQDLGSLRENESKFAESVALWALFFRIEALRRLRCPAKAVPEAPKDVAPRPKVKEGGAVLCGTG